MLQNTKNPSNFLIVLASSSTGGARRGLTVREWKRKNKDEKPHMGTVAHYYANTENGKDVGLSVVIKRIRVSQDGHLDFDVDALKNTPLRYCFTYV